MVATSRAMSTSCLTRVVVTRGVRLMEGGTAEQGATCRWPPPSPHFPHISFDFLPPLDISLAPCVQSLGLLITSLFDGLPPLRARCRLSTPAASSLFPTSLAWFRPFLDHFFGRSSLPFTVPCGCNAPASRASFVVSRQLIGGVCFVCTDQAPRTMSVVNSFTSAA